MQCPNCKKEIKNNSNFCQCCGCRLTKINYNKLILTIILLLICTAMIFIIKNYSTKTKDLPVGMLTETVSIQQVRDLLNDINQRGIIRPETQISKIYEMYGKEVGDKFTISDDRKIFINVNGTFYPFETTNAVKDIIQKEQNKSYQNIMNKPLTKRQKEFLKI